MARGDPFEQASRRDPNIGRRPPRKPPPEKPPEEEGPQPTQPGQLAPPQIIIPPGPTAPSAAEIEARNRALGILESEASRADQRFQQQLGLQQEVLDRAREQDAELFPIQKELTQLALQRTKDLLPIEKELLEIQLDQIKRGPKPTPEQLELINETFDFSFDIGRENIQEQAGNALEQLREELAPSRGLRPTDTPIVDRAGRVQEQATRQVGQLARETERGRSSAKLNFPLAAQQLTAQQTQFQQGLLNSSREFQQRLAQQTRAGGQQFQSNLFNTASGLSQAPIPSASGNVAVGLASTLGNQRIQSASVQRPIVGFPGFAPFPPIQPGGGSTIGGIGGALIGAGSLVGAVRG